VRARDLDVSFTESLEQTGSLAKALEIARNPESRLDPTIVHRAFDLARERGAYNLALAFAEIVPVRDRDRREIAMLLFEQQLERAPIEAYRTALAHELPPWYLRRARDLAFRRAAETGEFVLAQRLPDGVFMIIRD
ncbi:MAG: hypothetical protein Q8R16_02825, partial [bacterium]|nr:hypothetical protein [bacterium]